MEQRHIQSSARGAAEIILLLLALLGIYGWSCESDLAALPYVRAIK